MSQPPTCLQSIHSDYVSMNLWHYPIKHQLPTNRGACWARLLVWCTQLHTTQSTYLDQHDSVPYQYICFLGILVEKMIKKSKSVLIELLRNTKKKTKINFCSSWILKYSIVNIEYWIKPSTNWYWQARATNIVIGESIADLQTLNA